MNNELIEKLENLQSLLNEIMELVPPKIPDSPVNVIESDPVSMIPIERDVPKVRKIYNDSGELHCDSGPAVIGNGTMQYYINGKLHRSDGPAIIDSEGSEFWYNDGKLHRDDGPAITWKHGTKEWYKNGVRINKK